MTKKDDGLRGIAVASLICSILSWLVFGIVLAPVGLALGLASIKSKNDMTSVIATIGAILGAISLVLLIMSFVVIATMR